MPAPEILQQPSGPQPSAGKPAGQPSQKSMTKAERRELQEKQRAAKRKAAVEEEARRRAERIAEELSDYGRSGYSSRGRGDERLGRERRQRTPGPTTRRRRSFSYDPVARYLGDGPVEPIQRWR